MSFNIASALVKALWDRYVASISKFYSIFPDRLPGLDHLAIIDLTSPNSGIPHLQKIFETINFCKRGEGYLPEKINDFIWMLYADDSDVDPSTMIPQVILADFRSNMLTKKNREIVSKYAAYYPSIDFQDLSNAVKDDSRADEVVEHLFKHLNCRFWPLPTYQEYMSLKEENELMSWVLLFGRVVNHFGISIYTSEEYKDLEDFNMKAKGIHKVILNNVDGEIKGSKQLGLEQSASVGASMYFDLDGGVVEVNDSFLEFVWRHSMSSNNKNHVVFDQFYQGFFADNANNIVESVYDKQSIKRLGC